MPGPAPCLAKTTKVLILERGGLVQGTLDVAVLLLKEDIAGKDDEH